MSFYRSLIAAVAALGLTTVVFAADESAASANSSSQDSTQGIQVAETSTPAMDTSNQTATQGTESKVNVNTASAKDLTKVKGINSARAKAIVSYRKKHGEFKSIDDLKLVKGFKGMSDDSFKKLEDQLTTG